MKRFALYGGIIIVIAVCSLPLLKKRAEAPRPPAEQTEPAAPQAAHESQPPQRTQITPTPEAGPAQAGQGQPPPANVPANERVTALSNALQAYSVQLHRPIAFYGKVVDQDDRPVQGARVEFVWAHFSPLPEGTSSTNTISGQEGLFSLAGVTGATLSVYVSKNGYDNAKDLNRIQFSYSATLGSTPFQPDPKNPVVFHLRKKE